MICNGMAFFPTDFIFQQTHEENPPPEFHGVSPLLLRRSMSFSGVERSEQVHGDIDEMSDDGLSQQLGEKKKRLNLEQVKTLEKSFELGNKLEPERKIQLARALGLQPRQIAIWFQNRRARWKTKQLERDYDLLKRQFDKLKDDNDALHAYNKKLHAELLALKSRESNGSGPINLNKQTKISWSNASDNSCDVNFAATRTPATDTPPYSHLNTNHVFPSQIGPTSPTHLLQSSSRSDFHYRKNHRTVPDESFSNLLSGIDDQPGFWAWPDQQQFH